MQLFFLHCYKNERNLSVCACVQSLQVFLQNLIGKRPPHMRKLHEYFVLYKEVVTYVWLCSLHPLLSSFYFLFDSVPWKIYSSFFSLQDFCYFCKYYTQNYLVKVTLLSWIVLKTDLISVLFVCKIWQELLAVFRETLLRTDNVDLSTVKLTHVISLPPWPNCQRGCHPNKGAWNAPPDRKK